MSRVGAEVTAHDTGRPHGLEWAALVGLIGFAVAVYWPSVSALTSRWNDEINTTYTHGYLIVLVSIWLLWRDRAAITEALGARRPIGVAIPLVLFLALTWLFAYLAGIEIVYVAILPLILWSAVLAAFGGRMARIWLFPLGYLYLAMPLWDAINPLAQWGTVYAVRSALLIFGIPAYFVENRVQIPEGIFEIADGCSGLHFLIVGTAIAALLGELQRSSWRERAGYLLLGVAVAALVNWVRVFSVILAGHLTHMQHYLVRVDHRFFGWVLFALALPTFFYLARRLPSCARGGATSPRENQLSGPPGSASATGGYGVSIAAVLVLSVGAMGLATSVTGVQTLPSTLPSGVGGWQGPVASRLAWYPTFNGADKQLHASYSMDGKVVDVFSAWYLVQGQGREFSGFGNTVSGDLQIIATAGSRTIASPFNEVILREQSGRQLVVWYGFQVGDRWFQNATRAQFWYAARHMVRFTSPVSRVMALASPCMSNCDAARVALRDFMQRSGFDRSGALGIGSDD